VKLTYHDGVWYLGAPPQDDRAAAAARDANLVKVEWHSARLSPDWVWWGTRSRWSAAVFTEVADRAALDALGDLAVDHWLSRATDAIDDYPVPPGLQYLPFQRAGIQFAVTRRHALIADEMGLGKTVQALGVANAIGARSILIICPASIRRQWVNMCRTWLLNGNKWFIQVIEKSSEKISPAARIVIVSYTMISIGGLLADALFSREYDLAILDEAHYLKNHTSARTHIILGAWQEKRNRCVMDCAKKVIALTGTPLPNRPREIYTLLRAFNWDAIGRQSYDKFCERFNPLVKTSNGATYEKVFFPLELGSRVRSMMIRRLKADVAPQLPDKTYEIVEVPDNAAIRTALRAESLLTIDVKSLLGGERVSIEERAAVAATRRQMGIAKVPRVVEHVEMVLDGGVQKLVLFCWHHEVIDLIAAILDQKGLPAVTLSGRTPASRRQAVIAKFVEDPSVRVVIAQITSGGVGVDGLQNAASVAVFAECSWTFADNEQAADRLHRHGQRYPVTVQFLVADRSLDQKVLTTALRKARNVFAVLDHGIGASR